MQPDPFNPVDLLAFLRSQKVAFAPSLPGNTLAQSFFYCFQTMTGSLGWVKV